MYSHLHFANYSLLKIRDLSGPYRHRCTPQKKLCWHKEGENTCLPQTELSTSQVFSVYSFQVEKLISFLLLPVQFTVLCCVCCKVQTEWRVEGEKVSETEHFCDSHSYSIWILDNCFWRVRASRKLLLNDYFPYCHSGLPALGLFTSTWSEDVQYSQPTPTRALNMFDNDNE